MNFMFVIKGNFVKTETGGNSENERKNSCGLFRPCLYFKWSVLKSDLGFMVVLSIQVVNPLLFRGTRETVMLERSEASQGGVE
jgi:hypothetical protein